jgi:hypothetical protein
MVGTSIATRKPVDLFWFFGNVVDTAERLTWHYDGTFQGGGDPHPFDIVAARR